MLRQVWSDENGLLVIRIIIIIVCSGAYMRSAVTVATAILYGVTYKRIDSALAFAILAGFID